MKVILVSIHPHRSPQAIPLAAAFLKAAVASDPALAPRVAVELIDIYAGDDLESSAATILAGHPDAVGFSCYAWNRGETIMLARLLRQGSRPLLLVAGGPEATSSPGHFLQGALFDYVIRGEGENAFRAMVAALLRGESPENIAGVTSPRSVGRPAMAEPPGDLEIIPSPYLAGILAAEPDGGALWQLSRGCDFACSFCFDQKGVAGVRRFSFGRLERELDFFVRRRVSQVFVLDSTFNRNPEQAKRLLRLILRKAPHIHFHFEARSEYIDREMAALFASVLCSVQIGLQSADPVVNKRVRRAFNPADFRQRISLLNHSGAVFGFDLIYGLPGDTLAGFLKSLDFALYLYPNHLDIFPLALLPGTELAGRAGEYGLITGEGSYEVQASATFPAADMAAAASLARACDIFYSRGRAVAWFNTVLHPLDQPPSRFLDGFGRWLEEGLGAVCEADLSDGEIRRLQAEYLSVCYNRKKLSRLLPAALDLVEYHFRYAAALLAPQTAIPTDRTLARADLLSLPLQVAPATGLARFTYEIIDLLEAGEMDLREFVRCFRPSGSWAAIYPRGGEVFTESLIEPYYRLLSGLDGSIPAGETAAGLGIPPAEAASFLEFAAAEGIVTLPAWQAEGTVE